MDFFDKKQDVFEVGLTLDGKKALASGSLKFEYYSFHDTDIVYDPSYLYLTMSNNLQVNRIQDYRQVLRPNLTAKHTETVSSKVRTETIEHNDLKHSFLGNSEIGQKYYPALELRCISSQFTGDYEYETNVYTSQRIPIVNIEVNNKFDEISKQWKIDDAIILAVNEINGKKEKKNFIIEFFEQIPAQGRRPVSYQPLLFKKVSKNIDNLSEDISVPEENSLQSIEANYYFSIQVDHKIISDIEFSALPPERQQQLRDLLYNVENTAVIC